MEFPVTKWDLPRGYQGDFAPRSCSYSSGKSIEKKKITCYVSLLRAAGSAQATELIEHSDQTAQQVILLREETVLMAFQVKGKCENIYHVTLCSRPAEAITGFCSQTVW